MGDSKAHFKAEGLRVAAKFNRNFAFLNLSNFDHLLVSTFPTVSNLEIGAYMALTHAFLHTHLAVLPS